MFFLNGAFLRWASNGGRRTLSYVEYGLAGSFTWATCTLIECPLQLVSSQMQVQILRVKADAAYRPEFADTLSYYSRAPAKYGLRALYSGFIPHLCRNTTGGFFQFGVFEVLRREWARRQGVDVARVGLSANIASAAAGGVLFWAVS